MGLGPFDLTGGPFLQLYGTLFVCTIVASLIIPRWLQPEGRAAWVRDPDQLAWLAGGPPRLFDTIVARLLTTGALTLGDRKTFAVANRSAAHTDAERRVLALPDGARWRTVEGALRDAADPIRREMIDAGLAIDERTLWQLRFWQTLPYPLLIAFGSIKWEVGTMRHRPVGDLTAFLIITGLIAIARMIVINGRTRAGDRTLAEARTRASRLRRAPTPSEAALAVALFGTGVLAGSPWAAFHQMRNSGDGSSSSGGDSGGGCGGGGCGGCGG